MCVSAAAVYRLWLWAYNDVVGNQKLLLIIQGSILMNEDNNNTNNNDNSGQRQTAQ